jgi:hypothetical protein
MFIFEKIAHFQVLCERAQAAELVKTALGLCTVQL